MFQLNIKSFSLIKKTGLSILIIPILTSCASTQKGKYFEAMLIGSTIGAIYGASRPEFKEENTMLYGSMAGLAGAATVAIFDDSDKKIKDMESKIKFLDESASSNNKNSLVEEVPEEFRALLESQNYDIYKINRWTRKGERYLVKESELIELTGKRAP